MAMLLPAAKIVPTVGGLLVQPSSSGSSYRVG
jgi:hypothetical protein